MLRYILRRRAQRDRAQAIYAAIVTQSRRPEFYAGMGVPDTAMGRFELISLHAFLVIRRLRDGGGQGARLAQFLFDAIFDDMDRNLREMGTGDLGVGKRVKALAKGFYGRAAAYEAGLAEGGMALDSALSRNLYAGVSPSPERVSGMAAYLARQAAILDGADNAALLAGRVDFGPPPEG